VIRRAQPTENFAPCCSFSLRARSRDLLSLFLLLFLAFAQLGIRFVHPCPYSRSYLRAFPAPVTLLRSRILTMKHGCVEGRDHEIISVRITLGVTHFPRYGIDEPSFFIFRAIRATITRKVAPIPRFLRWRNIRREAIVEKSFGRMQNPPLASLSAGAHPVWSAIASRLDADSMKGRLSL